MKQLLTAISVMLCIGVNAQVDTKKESIKETNKQFNLPVQDTTVQITLTLDMYRQLVYALDANIDSKKISKDIFDLFSKSAKFIPPAKKD
jgi:hypothetical protein